MNVASNNVRYANVLKDIVEDELSASFEFVRLWIFKTDNNKLW